MISICLHYSLLNAACAAVLYVLTFWGSDVSAAASPVESKVSVKTVIENTFKNCIIYCNNRWKLTALFRAQCSGCFGCHSKYWQNFTSAVWKLILDNLRAVYQHPSNSTAMAGWPFCTILLNSLETVCKESFNCTSKRSWNYDLLLIVVQKLTFTGIRLRIRGRFLSFSHSSTASLSCTWLPCGTWCSWSPCSC